MYTCIPTVERSITLKDSLSFFFRKNVINVYMHVEGGVTCTCTHAYHVVEENSSLLDERDYLTVFHVHV